ncbi:hypothetical protein J2739_002700 [Variovorax soli]|uniref:Translocator protein BipB-like C-terminal domain-containing protein n=2 Tax=Variovorax soli TaxID=376815 RepID=A0ABU1NER3_9BURK|nr:hypothetical protein [Variovorax soli]
METPDLWLTANISGLWASLDSPPIIPKAPLLSLSNVPDGSASQWMQAWKPPQLEPAELDIGALSCLITSMQNTFTALQTQTNLDSIDNNRMQRKSDFDKAQEEQKKAEAKAKEAKEAADKAMIGEWIAAVAGVIGAVFAAIGAAVATGGLLVAVAVTGVIMAVQSLANTACKQATLDGHGVKVQDATGANHDLNFSWGLAVEMTQAKAVADGTILRNDGKGHVIDAHGKIMTDAEVKAALEKNPAARVMSDEQMSTERMAVTVAIEAGLAVAMIACGIRGMVNAGKSVADAVEKTTKSVRLGIEAGNKTWERVGRGAEAVSSVNEVLGAAGDITSGGYAIHGANVQLESSNARAEQFYYEKKMKVALLIMRELQTACKHLMQDLTSTTEAMTQQIKEAGDLNESIARRIVQAN